MKIENINRMQKVTPSTSTKWITNYNEGDDIMNYSASKLLYMPLSVDVETIYREITNAKHESYIALMEAAIEAEENKKEEI